MYTLQEHCIIDKTLVEI